MRRIVPLVAGFMLAAACSSSSNEPGNDGGSGSQGASSGSSGASSGSEPATTSGSASGAGSGTSGSGSSSGDSSSGSSSGSGATSGSSSGSGSGASSGGTLDGGGPGTELQGTGTVSIVRTSSYTDVAAGFVPHHFIGIPDGGFGDSGVGCSMQSVGSCTVTTCVGLSWSDAGAGGDGGGGTDGGTFVSAGTIAVTGGTGPITPTLNSIGEYSYMSQSPGDPTIAGGTPLRISASGATAAAFTANITMPDDIVVTTPAQPSSFTTPIALSRSAGLNVAWTGGGVGDVIVALGQAGIATSVSCQFPSSAGNGTVPAAALAALVPTGAHGNPTTIVTIEPLARETVTQGGWQVSITAEASGGFAAEAAVE